MGCKTVFIVRTHLPCLIAYPLVDHPAAAFTSSLHTLRRGPAGRDSAHMARLQVVGKIYFHRSLTGGSLHMQLIFPKTDNKTKVLTTLRVQEKSVHLNAPSRMGVPGSATRKRCSPVNQQRRGARRACRANAFMQLIVGGHAALLQQRIHV
jgi:hypothetical protein